MTATKLPMEQLAQALDKLNQTTGGGWKLQQDKLCKGYKFADFQTAFGFMAMCALYCEKVNHHPEWSNVYNKVNVELTTHEAAGISEKDLALAQHMDTVYAALAG